MTRRMLACILAMASAASLRAFLIPFHDLITKEALARFSISGWEAQQIVRGAIDADLVEGALPITGGPYDQRFHFDNDFDFDAVADNYKTLAHLVQANLSKREKDPWEFGKILHAVEDFYSHSNYVVLYREAVPKTEMVGSIPTFEQILLDRAGNKHFIEILTSRLRTGRYPNRTVWPADTDHGRPWGPGMNKDNLNRTLFADARETALKAASWYLELYLHKPETMKAWRRLTDAGFGARQK